MISLSIQIMVIIWVITTISVIVGYMSALSNKYFTGLINIINESETLNLFGKILSNLLYVFLCPVIASVEWLIIGMTYHKGD